MNEFDEEMEEEFDDPELDDPRRWTGEKAERFTNWRANTVQRLVMKLDSGSATQKLRNEIAAILKKDHLLPEVADDVIGEAEAQIQRQRKEMVRSRLHAARQTLKEQSFGSHTLTDSMLANAVEQLEDLIPPTELEAYNDDLTAAKSGPLQYRDLAFIAILHYWSVTENGTKHEQFKGTSPFDRFKEGTTGFKFRDGPYDHRQIRYALTILEALSLTKEVEKAVHNYKDKSKNRAAVWTILDDPFWNEVFGSKKMHPPKY